MGELEGLLGKIYDYRCSINRSETAVITIAHGEHVIDTITITGLGPKDHCPDCGYSREVRRFRGRGEDPMFACPECGKPWAEDGPAKAAREEKP